MNSARSVCMGVSRVSGAGLCGVGSITLSGGKGSNYLLECNLTEYLTKRTFQRETIREEVGNDGKPREIKGFGEFHREKMKHL